MALLFPSSPIVGQVYTAENGQDYYWNGFAWQAGATFAGQSAFDLSLDNITDEGTAAYRNVPEVGNAAVDEVVMGNDTRLTNARTPLAHNHDDLYFTEGEITTALSGKADTNHIHAPTPIAVTYNNGGTTTISYVEGALYTATVSVGSTTWAISNGPTVSEIGSFVLDLTDGGSQTQNWFSGIQYAGGIAPDLTLSGMDRLVFLWNGTFWSMTAILDVKEPAA